MKILYQTTLLLAALAAPLAVRAQLSEAEIARLDTTLTAWGAERAGNADGSIPAYDGGLDPALSKVTETKNGFRKYGDPFPDEKPLYSISSANADQYKDKLDAISHAMLKKYPDYRIDVYPTRRTMKFPQWVQENSKLNARSAKTYNGGEGVNGVFGGVPFPIPKTGYEVMWNYILRWHGPLKVNNATTWYVDAAGKKVFTNASEGSSEYPYYDRAQYSREEYLKLESPPFLLTSSFYSAPARLAGNANIYNEFLGPTPSRRSWSYVQGQRRVRVSPDLAYDTPVTQGGGVMTFDDVGVFWGNLDRFDFKLVGKKELIVPYNAYRQIFESDMDKVLLSKFVNPDLTRWELHRVWVVEATVKPEFRHTYSKRVFYFDEDWGGALVNNYDSRGELYRGVYGISFVLPDLESWYDGGGIAYDLATGVYGLNSHLGIGNGVWFPEKGRGARFYTPESIQARGVR